MFNILHNLSIYLTTNDLRFGLLNIRLSSSNIMTPCGELFIIVLS